MLVVVLVTAAGALGSAGWARTTERSASVHSTTLEKYEYVFVDQNIVIYRIGGGYRRVASIPLHQMQGIRGVAGNARTHLLYVSYGPDTDAGQGHLLAYDLVAAHVAWDRDYSFGIDSMAISPDGTRIYMPTGELSNGSAWNVLNARDGDVIGTISGGRGPHNTIVGPSGRRVYLGPRQDNYLYVASTATNRIVRKVGPLINTVRPFTINGSETIAYTTATGFLGFQVSSLKSGRVLYTVPIRGFSWNSNRFVPSAPSHGIALAPDGKRLWVLDAPNSYVHGFDVSRVPSRAPIQIANVPLSRPMTGDESACAYDCARDGWLQLSRDGRYLFVGDSGDVVDTRTFRIITTLTAMKDSRKELEIWWRGNVPVFIGSRSSVGNAPPQSSPSPKR